MGDFIRGLEGSAGLVGASVKGVGSLGMGSGVRSQGDEPSTLEGRGLCRNMMGLRLGGDGYLVGRFPQLGIVLSRAFFFLRPGPARHT